MQLLGASLTGVGRNLTSVITPQEMIQTTYRDLNERLWGEAQVVAPVTPKPDMPVAITLTT